MNKLPISIIIIASNEAHNLPRALASVKDWAAEIVAVINDCHDDTQSILEQSGATVYKYDWQGFVVQKNRALAHATMPWVFNLDADEEVTLKMRRDIEQMVASESVYSAASFCRKTWFLGRWIKHGDWYPDRVTRLFRRDKGQYAGNYLHERLEINGKICKFNSNLLHYSFPDLYVFLAKLGSFTRNFEKANHHRKFSPLASIFRAWWKFFRCYIIKRGFLDGFPGLLIAIHQGYSTFFKYSILLDQKTRQVQPVIEAEDK